MTQMTYKTLLGGLLIAGFAVVAGAAPTQFTMTTTVQNAATLTQTTPMNFGTIFATSTAAGVAGVEDGTYSRKLTLLPAGTVAAETAEALVGPVVLALGGTPTAGAYSSPGLPPNATVKINLFTASDVAFTNAATPVAASCAYDTPALALAANKIVLANGADPSTAFFCLDVFTTNRTGLLGAGYALGFGVTDLTFNLGGTLVAQAPTTALLTRAYQAGTYTGSFGMEVSFP